MDKQLQEILSSFHQHEINYWLDSGTLLGLMRDGRLLESDRDLDIGIWDTERASCRRFCPAFARPATKSMPPRIRAGSLNIT